MKLNLLLLGLAALVLPRASPFSLLPQNFMLEAGNEKVPVYYNALNLLRSSVLNTNVYNINLTTVIIIVLFNALLAYSVSKILRDVGRSRELEGADWRSLGCLGTGDEDSLSCLASPLDGFALSVLALFLTYVLQTFLTTSASMRRRGNQEDLFFREFGCLNSASEHDFDQCLQRSACQSPERAITLLDTAQRRGDGVEERRSVKYGNMLNIIRRAAAAGQDGLDCSEL